MIAADEVGQVVLAEGVGLSEVAPGVQLIIPNVARGRVLFVRRRGRGTLRV